MAAILDQLRLVIEQVIRTMGYPGISLLMLVENLFPPIPSEVVMPFAGFLVNEGDMSFILVLIAGTIGAGLGAIAIYFVGTIVTEHQTRAWIERNGKWFLMSVEDYDRASQSFDKYGNIMILAGRLIPGVRSLISLPAGLKRMNFLVFAGLTLIGTILWNGVLITGGFILGRNWQMILSFLDTYELIVWVTAGLLLFIYIFRRVFQLVPIRDE
ncbi:MAG: DedA family protein [Anaerolineales bacterium]|jgi:membrane protein DedA with SNARE-associated domain